jgi:hypothetical protein
MSKNTRKNPCYKKAHKTLKRVIKDRSDKRNPVVGRRKITKKQQKTIINGYVKACVKNVSFPV